MEADTLFYDRALRRINRLSVAIAVAGSTALAAAVSWQSGRAFFVGSVLGLLNYRWLKKLAYGLGGEREHGANSGFAVLLGGRYLLLGAVAYVTVKYLGFDAKALLGGLFVPVAAVILEALFELIYARV